MEFSQIVDPVFHDSNSFGSMIHGLRCLKRFKDLMTLDGIFIFYLSIPLKELSDKKVHGISLNKARLP